MSLAIVLLSYLVSNNITQRICFTNELLLSLLTTTWMPLALALEITSRSNLLGALPAQRDPLLKGPPQKKRGKSGKMWNKLEQKDKKKITEGSHSNRPHPNSTEVTCRGPPPQWHLGGGGATPPNTFLTEGNVIFKNSSKLIILALFLKEYF